MTDNKIAPSYVLNSEGDLYLDKRWIGRLFGRSGETRAVLQKLNSHDALVKACEAAIVHLTIDTIGKPLSGKLANGERIEQLQAAVALAKGGAG